MINKQTKIAIVTDWIWNTRGSEKMLDIILEEFPNAEVFALFGQTKNLTTLKNLSKRKVYYSKLNKLPFINKYYRYTYFLWPYFIEQFNFEKFDIVLSLSTSVAKGVITGINTKHICYMNSPMRYAWDLRNEYFNKRDFSLWKRVVIPFFLHFIRIWDIQSNSRIDYLIASSRFISDRIQKYYKLKADAIIYPPVELEQNSNNEKRSDFYYFHSALEVNKGIMQTISAAIKYKFKLKISGKGSLTNMVKKMIKNHNNIEYLGWVDNKTRNKMYAKCKALIFPSIEDFGIVPLEANSYGTPVIALNYGGTKETIKHKISGILIENQEPESIYKGIVEFEKTLWNEKLIKKNAFRYDKKLFIKEIRRTILKQIDT